MIKFKPIVPKRRSGRPRNGDEAPEPTLVYKKPRKRGAPKGRPKPPGSGRKKGTQDKAVVLVQTQLEAAMAAVFGALTDAEISSITPLQIMQLGTQAAVRAGNMPYAMTLAEKWAPYVHPKMASITPDDDPNKAIIIKGGLPDPSKPPETDDAGS